MTKEVRFTSHALFEMKRRRIGRKEVISTIRNPGQILASFKGRKIFQALMGKAGPFLLRVIVKEDNWYYHVITVYKTSNISKYWKGP